MQVHKNHISELLKDGFSRPFNLGTPILDLCLQITCDLHSSQTCASIEFGSTDMSVYVLLRTHDYNILRIEGWKGYYCRANVVPLFHFCKDSEAQTDLTNCTFSHRDQKLADLVLPTLLSKCLNHCGSGGQEPQYPKVTCEQETAAFSNLITKIYTQPNSVLQNFRD